MGCQTPARQTRTDASVDGIDAATTDSGLDVLDVDATAETSSDAIAADGSPRGDSADDVLDGATSDVVDEGDGAAPSFMLSAGAAAVLDKIAVYRTGGTIDDDGDGVPDVTVTIAPDGTRTIVVVRHDGRERQRTVYRSPRDYVLTGDQNGDGTTDERVTVSAVGDVVTRLHEQDVDVDGTFDWRATEVMTPLDSERLRQRDFTVEEYQSSGASVPRAYQITAAYRTNSPPELCALPAGTMPSGGGAPCSVSNTELAFDWATAQTVIETHNLRGSLFGFVTAGPLACSAEQINSLLNALDRSLVDLDQLGDVNTGYRDQVRRELGIGELVYACAMPACLATTGARGITYSAADPAFSGVDHVALTAIHPIVISLGIDATEEIIVHEWLHFAGIGHPVSEDGEHQRDAVYSCARYANHCRGFSAFYLGARSDASSARDAAMCADLDNKPRFGTYVPALQSGDCYFEGTPGSRTYAPPYCGPDMMHPPTDNCPCCAMVVQAYCDQTLVPAARRSASMLDDYACCPLCPPADAQNWTTCTAGSVQARLAKPFPIQCPALAGCGY